MIPRIPGRLCLQPSIFNIDTEERRKLRQMRCWRAVAVIALAAWVLMAAIAYREHKEKQRFQESYDFLLDHPELSAK